MAVYLLPMWTIMMMVMTIAIMWTKKNERKRLGTSRRSTLRRKNRRLEDTRGTRLSSSKLWYVSFFSHLSFASSPAHPLSSQVGSGAHENYKTQKQNEKKECGKNSVSDVTVTDAIAEADTVTGRVSLLILPLGYDVDPPLQATATNAAGLWKVYEEEYEGWCGARGVGQRGVWGGVAGEAVEEEDACMNVHEVSCTTVDVLY